MTRSSVYTLAFLALAPAAWAADPAPPGGKPVSYSRDVRPVFAQHCQGCHQPAKAQGGYVMTDFASLLKPGETDKPPVVPGKPADSYLVDQITAHGDAAAEMPKGRDALKTPDVELITRWVKEGAADDTPAAARGAAFDTDNPPVYAAAPVVTSLAFSPDGSLLAVTGYHEILLHKADGSGLAGRLVGASERVQSLAFSPDGKRLAAAAGSPGRFGEVQVWDVAKRRLTLSVPATSDTVYGVSWSPDASLIGFGCADNTVRAVDARTGKQVLYMGTHADWVLDTVFSRDGSHIVSVSRDMSLKLTEVPTQRFVDNVTSITPGGLKGGLMSVDRRPSKDTKRMAKPADDTPNSAPRVYDELLCAGSDGVPRLYKMHREVKRVIGDDANLVKAFAPMPGRVSRVRFDPVGTHFAAASSLDGKGEVRVYDVATGKHVKCDHPGGAVYAVGWRPDGKVVAAAGFDGSVTLIDPVTGKGVKTFPAAPVTPQTTAR